MLKAGVVDRGCTWPRRARILSGPEKVVSFIMNDSERDRGYHRSFCRTGPCDRLRIRKTRRAVGLLARGKKGLEGAAADVTAAGGVPLILEADVRTLMRSKKPLPR